MTFSVTSITKTTATAEVIHKYPSRSKVTWSVDSVVSPTTGNYLRKDRWKISDVALYQGKHKGTITMSTLDLSDPLDKELSDLFDAGNQQLTINVVFLGGGIDPLKINLCK